MVKIIIETDNAAFGDDPGDELARILRRLADLYANGRLNADITHESPLRDANGNTVGSLVQSR